MSDKKKRLPLVDDNAPKTVLPEVLPKHTAATPQHSPRERTLQHLRNLLAAAALATPASCALPEANAAQATQETQNAQSAPRTGSSPPPANNPRDAGMDASADASARDAGRDATADARRDAGRRRVRPEPRRIPDDFAESLPPPVLFAKATKEKRRQEIERSVGRRTFFRFHPATSMPRVPRPPFSPQAVDSEGVDRALSFARDAGVQIDDPGVRALIAAAGVAAPGILTALFSHPSLALQLGSELSQRGTLESARVDASRIERAATPDLAKKKLRTVRNEALARTALREVFGFADVDRTAREWSSVASGCIEYARRCAAAWMQDRNGPPFDEQKNEVPFVVLGMGKLGGAELNLGSDVDICFFYATDEGAAGTRTLNEHFARLGATLSELLSDVTEDGFAFRVDLRLRPEGSRGTLANSLAGAERYYETWGRSWERAALLRARPVAGDGPFGTILLEALRPFVFRRTVDPSIARDVFDMLARARRELLRDDVRDLKLGAGGIREAEFFVQALQLVWGGRHPSLQVSNTLEAAARLRALGLLSHREARAFGDAWALLRRIEHRVQSMAAYATHLLPTDPVRYRALALSFGYDSIDAFEQALNTARANVRSLAETALPGRELTGSGSSPPGPEVELADLIAAGAARSLLVERVRSALGVRDAETAADELQRLARRADLPLGAVTRERHRALGPLLLREVRDAPDPDRALWHLSDLFSRLGSAERYARRLAEDPALTRGLVGLFGASETLSSTLLARPDLLDAVLTGGGGAIDENGLRERVTMAVQAAKNREEDPIDAVVGALRKTVREVQLEVGLADLAGVLAEFEVTERLSTLAACTVQECFALAGEETMQRFGLPAGAHTPLDGFAVVALGSLAARELGHEGDVDLIVLHELEGDTAGGRRGSVSAHEYAARLAQRALLFLSAPHAEGPGYAVDTRLRPSGAQGTLVTTIEGFRRYHAREAGRPGAQAWERQALIRSRPVAGAANTCARVASLIDSIAYEQGSADAAELLRLRGRMERELGGEPRGARSLKYGPGSLVDVEFAAQWLQLEHGTERALRTPNTRAALLALRELGVLSIDDAEALLLGEGFLRKALLATRLVTAGSVLHPGTAATHTIARKLGYRERSGRSADALFLETLDEVRRAVRAAFERVLSRRT